MVGDPCGTDAERKAWMDAQNAEGERRRQTEREERASRQQQVETTSAAEPKKSWIDRAREMGDKLKSEFNTAVEGIKEMAPKPIEPGHGPTTVDIYNKRNPDNKM